MPNEKLRWLSLAGEKRWTSIRQIDLGTEYTEDGRSAGRNNCWAVIAELEFTCWVKVPLGNFLGHFSVRFVLISVHCVQARLLG